MVTRVRRSIAHPQGWGMRGWWVLLRKGREWKCGREMEIGACVKHASESVAWKLMLGVLFSCLNVHLLARHGVGVADDDATTNQTKDVF